MICNVLTIAGSDSGGGAGIQADIKTLSALGVYSATVVTAITAQNTRGVGGIHEIPVEIISEQIDFVLQDIEIHAVKIGMLGDDKVIAAVATALRKYRVKNIVLDPVMIAKSGARLINSQAVSFLSERLIPGATVLTPNLPEAATLLGIQPIYRENEMREVAGELLQLGPEWVLLKGGHLAGERCVDILANRSGVTTLESCRQQTKNTHGTGCTYSSAVAAHLARGDDVPRAVVKSHSFLQGAIAASDKLSVGGGYGPVHHFYAAWSS